VAKDITISFRMQPALAERLEAFRTWLELEEGTLTRSDALIYLIHSAVEDDGRPAFRLRPFDDDPDPKTRAWRRRMRNDDRRHVTCSFRADAETVELLDRFARWMAARAIVEATVDRGAGIRTLILQGLGAPGSTPRFAVQSFGEDADLIFSGGLMPLSHEAIVHMPEDEGFDPPTRVRGDSGAFDALPLKRIVDKP